MEINKIIESLAHYDLTCLRNVDAPTFIETHKMIKPGQRRFYDACLYVGYASELPTIIDESSRCNVIVIDDAPVTSNLLENKNLNMYLAPSGTNQFDILNEVADIMIDEAMVVVGMRRLIDALYSGAGIQAIVNTAAELFGNPVFVNDAAYKILAISEGSAFTERELEEERRLKYVHPKIIEQMRADNVEHKLATQGSAIVSQRAETDVSWMFSNVKIHDIAVATIAVAGFSRAFTAADYELLNRLSKIIAIELEKNEFYREDKSVMYEYLLGDLLSGKLVNPATIEARCQVVRWKPHAWFGVIVIANPLEQLSGADVSRLETGLRRTLPQCRWTIYRKELVVFVTRTEHLLFNDDQLERFKDFLQQSGLEAGVSSAFASLADSKRHYEQASRALDMGSRLGRRDVVFFFSEMLPYYIARQSLRRNSIQDFQTDSIKILLDYDKENDSSLLQTLECYFRHAGSPLDAARELNIHRNTLLYRVNKARDLAGIDLSDGNARLAIQLYMKMSEITSVQ